MLLEVTSSMTWCCLSPLIAENMPRIIGASLAFRSCAASCARSGRALCGAPLASCDHGAVDVGEHLLAHVLGVDRRHDGPVLDGDHERSPVQENDRDARPFSGCPIDAGLQPLERLALELDAATLDPLQRVLGELQLLG